MNDRRGVTLIEVMIAVSLFAIVTVIANGIFSSMVEIQKKSNLQNAVFSDMQIIIEQLIYEIQHGSIDYEEYYNVCVIQNACKSGSSTDAYLGINYGVYGSRFFDPGARIDKQPSKNPENLGVECDYPKNLAPGQGCEIIFNPSIDLNVGQNPFVGNADSANAFCDNGRGLCGGNFKSSVTVDKLFLINDMGNKKTMLGRKLVTTNDWAIGKVVMDGKDLDQNGLVDTFICKSNYNCYGAGQANEEDYLSKIIKIPQITNAKDIGLYGITIPRLSDLKNVSFFPAMTTSNFVPITPLRTSVKELSFVISPVEDPYKAFTEKDIAGHPSVTINIVLGLSENAAKNYPGDFKDVTFTTTVASGVVGRVDTYPPITDINAGGSGSWINKINGVPGSVLPSSPY